MVSIIVPTYNRAKLIGESVHSVLDQTYSNWELIIVDDGSTDNTFEVLKPYLKDSRISYYNRPSSYPKGANACRNYGFELAKGEYLKWLDSDDLLTRNCLEMQLEQIQKEKADVNICQSKFFRTDENETSYQGKKWGRLYFSKDILNDLIYGKIRWQTAAGLWKKNLFLKTPFNEQIQNSQEWLFHIEICMIPDIKFSFTDESLVLVRVGEASMSNVKNKGGDYYFHSSLARHIAIENLYKNRFDKKTRFFLFKIFLWYQLFTLYKGSPVGFLRLMTKSPQILYKSLFD